MVTQTLNEQARFAVLRGAYYEAFHELTLQVQRLQALPASDRESIDEARRQVEQAQLAYRNSRNALARFMLVQHSEGKVLSENKTRTIMATTLFGLQDAEDDQDLRTQVEHLAHQLWEQSGRPNGRAEEHWYQAERWVRNNVAVAGCVRSCA
jgi:hypothetical protein